MSSHNYSILVVDPLPNVKSPNMHTSRGGAGNVTNPRNLPKVPHHPSAPTASTESKRPGRFASGRGGAGNAHHSSERAIFSFDEELEKQLKQQKDMAPVYSVGRGGAGNMIYGEDRPRSSVHSDAASARSISSMESGPDAITRNMKKSLERKWSKVLEKF